MVFFAFARIKKGGNDSIPDGESEVANDFIPTEKGNCEVAANSSIPDGGVDGEEEEDAYSHLSPKAAFEKFDTNGSGDIDEDEFFHLLEAVGMSSNNEEYQERLFRRYAKKSGSTNVIDYGGFKAAWLLLGNPLRELIDRGVRDVPKSATRRQLVRLLEKTIDDEERLDGLARAEADRYRTLCDMTNVRREYVRKAKDRAGLELAAALDAAGQVYVLGTGAHGQFHGVPKRDMSTSSFHLEGTDLIQSLWEDRVRGDGDVANPNTAGVWGRRPRKVALADDAIFALTDSGILSWGGKSIWHAHSIDQPIHRASAQLAQTTPRSSVLLMKSERTHKKHTAVVQEEADDENARSASVLDKVELVLKYYGYWPAHFDGTNDLGMVRDHLTANVQKDSLFQSLLLRGKPCEKGLSKFEMTEILAQDIRLEKEVLGEKGQQQLCDMEREIVDLIRRNEIKQADYLRLKFVEKWSSLSKEQKLRANIDDQRKEDEQRSNRDRQEKDYKDWNAKRTGLERASVTEHSGLMAGAITTRGADIQTPRGESQCLNIEAGAHHAAIIVQDERSRSLYTWGVSSLGRLGHGESEFEDCNYPRIVEELKGTSIIEISCGHSHSAAVSKNGHLFMWGSASSGELGFGGEISDYFCTAPTRLLIPCCTVVKVSCGAAHTACIGKSGEMYVWGSCDGGRLGLGRDQIGTRYTPTVVNSLRHEKIVDVSCGTFVSLALTESENVGTHGRTSVKRMTGGRLYVAGPKNVLGASFPSFGELECMRTKPAVIKSIAAGYSHQAFVSQSGELYCWGHNIHGCCGQPETATFISEPALVERLYKAPKNLALGKPCHLSTLYKDTKGLSASNAVDGHIDGNDISSLAHTQFQANPYFEVDLGSMAYITNIRVWNRTNESDDSALPLDVFSKRLFPCFVMISQFPARDDLQGKEGLASFMSQSVAHVRFSEDTRLSNWNVPKYTVGRYVRIQLEGSNFLHFTQIEVFGHEISRGPISSCSAGKFVTAAVVGCIGRDGMKAAYKRAVFADWYNAEILRQFSTYANEYSEQSDSFNNKAKCLLCVGNIECEICSLMSKFRSEVQDIVKCNHPYRLGDIEAHLLNAKNIERSYIDHKNLTDTPDHESKEEGNLLRQKSN